MNRENPPKPKNRTWSLLVGLFVICISLWALHQFCDGYSDFTRILPVYDGTFRDDILAALPTEGICTRWLGAITWLGAFGVVFLLGAGAVQKLADGSRGWLRLAAAMAMAGRLIALGSLAFVALVLILFSWY